MKKVKFKPDLDELDIITDKELIEDLITNDEFLIELDGDRAEFFILFQQYLEENFEYCEINDLCSGGAEPENTKQDGEPRISSDGLVENWYFNFWTPETENTDFEQSETPLRVKLSGWFFLDEDDYVFTPKEMSWNEDDLKVE